MIRLICLFCCLSSVLTAQRNFPANAANEAAETIYTEIREKHPYPATLDGLQALEAARTQVQEKVAQAVQGRDSISYPEFIRLVAPLQEVTGCGHLILEPHFDSLENQAIRENVLPLHMIRLADGRHVLYEGLKTLQDSFPPGTEVVALADEPVGPLMESLAYFSGLNDQGNDAAGTMKVIRYPSNFYQWHYGLRERLGITLRADDGTLREDTILAFHRPYIDPREEKTDINRTLNFRFSEDRSTGILRIRKFSSYQFSNGNYYKFIRNVFDTLQQTQTRRLIIDIRDNGGGSGDRINALYRYLAEQKFLFASNAVMTGPARAEPGENKRTARRRAKGAVSQRERKIQRSILRPIKPVKPDRHYAGAVVVLVNELSFSASGIFARYVQGSGRGKLVGMPAGASAGITYGASSEGDPILIGPAQNFELKINGIGLVPEFPAAGNVTPDVLVPVTVAALRAGRDEQLERALEVVAGKTE